MNIPKDISAYIPQIHRMDAGSHKGQNGRVLLIGGSDLFHAASRWSLEVLSAMVDMVFYASVPENNALIREAKREFWSGVVIPRGEIESYIAEADVILIGPGMTRGAVGLFEGESVYDRPTELEWNEDTGKIVNYLVSKYPTKKWVIDAGALQMIDPRLLRSTMIITPHEKELSMVMEHLGIGNEGVKNHDLFALSEKLSNVTIVYKGSLDSITNGDIHTNVITVAGGNPGMTKGGTGDVLAGLIAGLYTHTENPLAAAVIGSFVNKAAADVLATEVGPFFTTNQLVTQVPKTLYQVLYH